MCCDHATDGPDLVLGMMVASFAVFWMLFGGSPQALTATAVYYTCGAGAGRSAQASWLRLECRKQTCDSLQCGRADV